MKRYRYVTVRRYGDVYTVVDWRGRVYLRTRDVRKARNTCIRVLNAKRRKHRRVPRHGTGNKVEIRRKGNNYTVVDRTGRVYAHATNETDATREWRRAIKGLSREEGRRVGQ